MPCILYFNEIALGCFTLWSQHMTHLRTLTAKVLKILFLMRTTPHGLTIKRLVGVKIACSTWTLFFLYIGGDQAKTMVKHCFSYPWKDSDLVLVVEGDKFHVHRLILSLNSPVFEAMFKSQFKESTANEIPLPEKKACRVLDFLKIIYCFQYIRFWGI